MAAGPNSKKAHTARRIVEILEFFDEQTRQATVMEIARRFNRPQSSTSELLSALVEMGLLYKNPRSRSFSPTPRAAMLGSIFQPSLVRDGRLSLAAEELTEETGLGTAILGMVGVDLQVFRWIPGSTSRGSISSNCLFGGAQAPLWACAAGWLMLSTLPVRRSDSILHRLRAEAPMDQKFDLLELRQTIYGCGRQGHAVGPVGFGTGAEMCTVLLPCGSEDHAMALAVVFDSAAELNTELLTAKLKATVERCSNRGQTPLPRALVAGWEGESGKGAGHRQRHEFDLAS